MKHKLFITLFFLLAFFSSPSAANANWVADVVNGFNKALTGCGGALNQTLACSSNDLSSETTIGGTADDNSLDYSISDIGTPSQISKTGAIGATATLIGSVYSSPPAGTQVYIADILHNSLIPQTYAQGVGLGFSSLVPILPIWKAFRNMAYFLFVIIFVVVGFAIMFRRKLNPQTVISIQSSLPNLAITLILITFSYAIAGLMIDLMYLSIYFIVGVFDQFIFTDSQLLRDLALNNNLFQNFQNIFTSGAVSAMSKGIGDLVVNLIGDDILGIINGISSGVAYLVIAIAILFALFKTLFSLISTYINIILSIIFSPIQIMLNVLPGSGSFNKWLRGLVANLAVFPAIIGMIILAHALTGSGTAGNIGYQSVDGGFLPPQIPGRGSVDSIQAVIALGVVLLMPEVSKLVKKAFQVEDSGLGAAAMQGLGKGTLGIPQATGRMVGGGLMLAGQQKVGQSFAGWWGRRGVRKPSTPVDTSDPFIKNIENVRQQQGQGGTGAPQAPSGNTYGQQKSYPD